MRWRSLILGVWGVLMVTAAGCVPEPSPNAPDVLDAGMWRDAPQASRRTLVDHAAWQPVPAAADPIAAHRPEVVSCPDVSWGVEGGSLEVNTGECNYLALGQPLGFDVRAETPLRVDMWHQALHAEHFAEAHIALFARDTLIWERTVPIPAPPVVWQDTVVLDRDLQAGELLVFHLHNHGANTWNLGTVREE